MALVACLGAVMCVPGCRPGGSWEGHGPKSLLRDESVDEEAIRKAAIEDTSFPAAAQPIPKKS